jgi:hypothetical protein
MQQINSGTPLSGKDGRFTINGQVITLEMWKVDPEASDVNGYNFESQGFDEGVFGKRKATITAKGFWDSDKNPNGSPVKLKDGQILDNCQLFITRNTSRCFTFPLLRVPRVTVQNEADGRVDIEFTGVSQGKFFYPGEKPF